MTSQKGIVVKTKDSYCVVVTPEGVYKKVKLPTPTTTVGAEITFNERNQFRFIKPLAFIAASVLIALFFALSHFTLIPQPETYVSLDINPSLELAVDTSLIVTNVESYNMDGTKLINTLRLKDKSLSDAIKMIFNASLQQQYLSQEQEGIIVAGVSGKPGPHQDKIARELTKALTAAGVSTKVKSVQVVYKFDETFRQAAKQQGLTAGKYLLLRQARFENGNVLLDDIKSQNVGQILFSYGLELLPNDDLITLEEDDSSPSNEDKNTSNKGDSGDDPGLQQEEGQTNDLEESSPDSDRINQNRHQTQTQTQRTTSGNTSSGNTDSGNTDSGNADSGNTDSGNADSGNTDSGNADSGNTSSGSTDSGNTSSGNTDSGNTSSGNTDSGNTSSGNTDSGNTDSGNTSSGNTDSGNTDSGNTSSGNTDSGNTDSGNTSSGNTDSGNTSQTNAGSDSGSSSSGSGGSGPSGGQGGSTGGTATGGASGGGSGTSGTNDGGSGGSGGGSKGKTN